ncbi:unnamed protein product [Gordionus sp. m RMFG-2023]|uniref:large ribosomal subunit protein uL13-like n=1 Tax=Gordionus sp. m RMFG-2023 TaxID=3053472 RepID=UPI0030E35452
MSFYGQPLVIDGKGHLLGRLSTIVAKHALQGQKVVVVRCEKINISGKFIRNKLKYLAFLRKRCNVNPARGPFHLRAPSKILLRTIRGMLPHKTHRGSDALKRIKAFEGIPPLYNKCKRRVIPSALRVIKLIPGRRFCELSRLSHEVGWKYQKVIETLETKRISQGKRYYEKKKKERQILVKAKKNVAEKIKPYQDIIESYGGH